MLDIQFTVQGVLPDRPLVYIYDTGELKRDIFDVIARLARECGRALAPVAPDLLFMRGLFDDFKDITMCEWPNGRALGEERLIRQLIGSDKRDVVVVVNRRSKLLRNPGWVAACEHCLVIEEHPVTAAELPAALRHLQQTTRLAPELDVSRRDFCQIYDALVAEGPITWTDLKRTFQDDVLTNFDPKSGSIERAQADHLKHGQGRIMLVHLLRTYFREAKNDSARIRLLQALERKWLIADSAKGFCCDLLEALDRIVTGATADPDDPVLARAAQLTLLLFLHEDALTSVKRTSTGATRPGTGVITLHALIRELKADPSAEIFIPVPWPDVLAALNRLGEPSQGHLARVRHQLATNLVQKLHDFETVAPGRIERLRQALEDALAQNALGTEVVRTRQPLAEAFAYAGFDDIPGAPTLAGALRRHVLEGSPRANFLFCGPAGAAKSAIARVLAKASLCAAPTPNPCGSCPACIAFDRAGPGGGFGYTEFVAGAGLDGPGASALVEGAYANPFTERHVVVVRDADKLDEAAADRMLRTLEALGTITISVFLASDQRRVRAALRSRCQVFRVGLLGMADALAWAHRCCTRDSIELDDERMRIAIAVGRGSPAGILQAVRQAARLGTGLDELRRQYDLGWPAEMLAFWRSALDGNTSSAWMHLSGEQRRTEALARYLVDLSTTRTYHWRPQDEPALAVADHVDTLAFIDTLERSIAAPRVYWTYILETLRIRPMSFPQFVAHAASLGSATLVSIADARSPRSPHVKPQPSKLQGTHRC